MVDELVEVNQPVAIFVGSTFDDLKPYRRAIHDALVQLEAIARGMEYFGSKPGTPVAECLAVVRSCSIYIGVFAMRYGSIPDGFEESMTHLEYNEAQRSNLLSLIYLIDESSQPVLPKDVETGQGAVKLRTLKDQLRQRHLVSLFTTPESLAAKILHDVPVALRSIVPKASVRLTVRIYSTERLQSEQPWREIGHCRFHRDFEVAADPVFDLMVENMSGGSLLLLKTGIRILQRRPRRAGMLGEAQPTKVQAEYSVQCREEWKRDNLNHKEAWKSFKDPMWMKKDDSPFRFTLCLDNFCDADNASSSEIRFCLQTSIGTVESESFWLEQ
jgi:Domain of unknown function (DUF4062)